MVTFHLHQHALKVFWYTCHVYVSTVVTQSTINPNKGKQHAKQNPLGHFLGDYWQIYFYSFQSLIHSFYYLYTRFSFFKLINIRPILFLLFLIKLYIQDVHWHRTAQPFKYQTNDIHALNNLIIRQTKWNKGSCHLCLCKNLYCWPAYTMDLVEKQIKKQIRP